MRLTGLAGDAEFAQQMDKTQWPHLKDRLRDVMLSKSFIRNSTRLSTGQSVDTKLDPVSTGLSIGYQF